MVLDDKSRTESRRGIPRLVIEQTSSRDIGDEFARLIQRRDVYGGCYETRSAARETYNNNPSDRDYDAPISPNGRGSIFLQTAAHDRDNVDVQAPATSRDYGTGDNHENLLRWRRGLVFAMTVLALTVLGTVGTVAYRDVFGAYVFSALAPIFKDGTKPNTIRNHSDGNQSSITSAGSNVKFASREQQPGITAPSLDAPVAPALDPDFPPSVSTPASVHVLVPVLEPVSPEPKKIHAVMVASDERSATDTSSLRVLSPHSPTRAAARSSTAAAPPSESHGVHGDTSPSKPSRFHMRAGRRTVGEAYAAGSYAVQLASEHSAAAARTSFRALRATFPNQLGGRKPIVRRTDLGAKGIYYRAMVGPFASMQKAAGMCARLKTVGGDCLVQRN